MSEGASASDLKFVYNPVDSYFLHKMNKEVKHILCCGRVKLTDCDKRKVVPPLDVVACTLPPLFLLNLKEWLLKADYKDTTVLATFDSIIIFLVEKMNM